MSREAGRLVRRALALVLTIGAVASMLSLESPGRGVVEAQLLILALFLAV
jgi:hypothetical protein